MGNQDNYSSKPLNKQSKGGDPVKIEIREVSHFANIEPIEFKPLEVKVYNNNFDKALRAFRALVQKERILSSYKENQTYEKPSDKKRRKRNERKRKIMELEEHR